MALNISIVVSETAAITEPVPDDVAKDLRLTYDNLAALPSNRQANADFATEEEAAQFTRQAKAWAAANSLTFTRKAPAAGKTIKDMPLRVAFRVYQSKDQKAAANAVAGTDPTPEDDSASGTPAAVTTP